MKNIDGKNIDMTDAEYDYYQKLVKKLVDENGNSVGETYFQNLFDVDGDGFITIIRTEKSMPWAVLFFVQQIMINQRMRANDSFIKEAGVFSSRLLDIESRLSRLENQGDRDE